MVLQRLFYALGWIFFMLFVGVVVLGLLATKEHYFGFKDFLYMIFAGGEGLFVSWLDVE